MSIPLLMIISNVIKKITGHIEYNKSIKDIQHRYKCNINNIKKLPTDNSLWNKKIGPINSCCIVFSTRISTADLVKWVKFSRYHKSIYFFIGNFFKGKYIGNGKLYDEKSVCIEVAGIPTDMIIRLAVDISRKFGQESILVKDYSNGKNLLIDVS